MNSEIIDKSFDSILNNLGYKVESKYKTEDFVYAKVKNPHGHLLYVVNDDNLGYSSGNLTVLTKTDTNLLSFAFKKGSFSAMNNSNYGILIESMNDNDANITIMKYDIDLKPKEENYSIYQSPEAKSVNSSSTITCPIISIRDLLQDSTLVLHNTDKNISKFRNSQLELHLEELEFMFNKIDKLEDIFIEFNDLRTLITESLNTRIGELNKWNYDFMNTQIMNDKDLEIFRVVFDNLCLRNEQATSLLRLNNKILESKKQIDIIYNSLQSGCEYLMNIKKNIDIRLIK